MLHKDQGQLEGARGPGGTITAAFLVSPASHYS